MSLGNPDPSRERLPGVSCRPADGLDDPVFLQSSFDGGGSQLAVAHGEPCRGSDRYSTVVPDRSGGKSRRWHRSPLPGKTSDGEQLRLRVPSSPEGETGQRPPIMAA